MLGNAWEWVGGGEPSRRTLRGGSFVDYNPLITEHPSNQDPSGGGATPKKKTANHAITPATRMETTQDSGSANTSFRCASTLKKGSGPRKGSGGEEAPGRVENGGVPGVEREL